MLFVMNSYILYKLNTQEALNRQDYLIQIIESVASEYKNIIFERQSSQQTSSGIKTLPGQKRKIVVFALIIKKPEIGCKRTRTICSKCDKGLHGTCLSKHKCQ